MPNIQEILFQTFQKLLEQLFLFTPKVLGAIVLLIIGIIIAKIVTNILQKGLEKLDLINLATS